LPSLLSAFAPLRHRDYAVIWTANVVSLVGTWMNEIGAGWLMASLTPSPLWVGLVQTAATLPVFLFALPAGALADLVDRRRMILINQVIMGVGGALFALLVWRGWVAPWSLLLFCAFLGTGLAFYAPVRNAVVPRLVPKEDLQEAIVLNGLGVNLARTIGPALAGFLVTWIGLAAPFVVNALSFVGVVIAYWWWRPPATAASTAPREALLGAVAAGVRYARASSQLRAIYLRMAALFLPASAFWALLPLIAKQVLSGDAELYGLLLGGVGAGAVVIAVFLPALRARLGVNRLLVGASLVLAIAMAGFALLPTIAVALLAALGFGAAWVASVSILNASAQIAVPDWVRARAMSLLLVTMFGSLALGSALWGQVASEQGIRIALLAAAAAELLLLLLVRNRRVPETTRDDLEPAGLPAPVTDGDVPPREGPIMVTIEYRVLEGHEGPFTDALMALSAARRRLGAFSWGMLEDAAERGRFIEYYLEPSWGSHLRHHERVSGADLALKRAVECHLQPDHPSPRVTHLVPPRVYWDDRAIQDASP
jgi:MFS family permease